MSKKQPTRNSHVTKGRQDIREYKLFVKEKSGLDKTEADPIDTRKTEESSVEDGNTKKPSSSKSRKKSTHLWAWDLLKKYWKGGVGVGVILVALSQGVPFLFALDKQQAIQAEKIGNLETKWNENIDLLQKDIDKLKEATDNQGDGLYALESKLEILRIEITKDLELLRKRGR